MGAPELDCAEASEIVGEGGEPAPCPAPEGKLHKTCRGEELQSSWSLLRWEQEGWMEHPSTSEPLSCDSAWASHFWASLS